MSLLLFLGPQTQQPAPSEPSSTQNTPNDSASGDSSNNANQTSSTASQSSSDSVVISDEARESSAPLPANNSSERVPTQARVPPSSSAPRVQSSTSTSPTVYSPTVKLENPPPTVYAPIMIKLELARKGEPLEFEKIQKPVTSRYAIYTSAARQYNALDELITGKLSILEVA